MTEELTEATPHPFEDFDEGAFHRAITSYGVPQDSAAFMVSRMLELQKSGRPGALIANSAIHREVASLWGLVRTVTKGALPQPLPEDAKHWPTGEVQQVLSYPNTKLKTRCKPVEELTDEVMQVIADLASTMYANAGIGLAAPQIGSNLQIFVVDIMNHPEVNQGRGGAELLVAINPEVVPVGAEQFRDEECLSVPGLTASVRRRERMVMRAQNSYGEPYMLPAGGLLGRVCQHECDHLYGTLFLDRLSRNKRRTALQKIRANLQRRGR